MRRRLSQLDLATEACISQRHLSFLENGRAQPSRDMAIHLAEKLGLPLRERNALLGAAGFGAFYIARQLDDPSLRPARAAIERVLQGHEPYPALAVDRHWMLVSANKMATALIGLVQAPALLAPPVNVLRLTLHPEGLAPLIVNLPQWRAQLLSRLALQVEATMDPVLTALHLELRNYAMPEAAEPSATEQDDVVVSLMLRTPLGDLSFMSMTTLFGTPTEVTLSEIAIESFFPADDDTRSILMRFGECRDA